MWAELIPEREAGLVIAVNNSIIHFRFRLASLLSQSEETEHHQDEELFVRGAGAGFPVVWR